MDILFFSVRYIQKLLISVNYFITLFVYYFIFICCFSVQNVNPRHGMNSLPSNMMYKGGSLPAFPTPHQEVQVFTHLPVSLLICQSIFQHAVSCIAFYMYISRRKNS